MSGLRYVTGENARPVFDERDAAILAKNIDTWNSRSGPRVGDWCRMPNGDMKRFTYNWGEGLQTTCGAGDAGSFYFSDGYMDYSGSLDPIIGTSRIKPTDETKPGAAWFFHHNHARAHNGVYVNVDCRVFEVTP